MDSNMDANLVIYSGYFSRWYDNTKLVVDEEILGYRSTLFCMFSLTMWKDSNVRLVLLNAFTDKVTTGNIHAYYNFITVWNSNRLYTELI